MKLRHLISIRRYLRCRRIFASPLNVHYRIAAASQRPVTLNLLPRSTLTIHDTRKSRNAFSWILQESPDPFPVTSEDGLLVFTHERQRIALRPVDTDFFTFREVFVRDVYRINSTSAPLKDVIDIGANVGLFAVRIASLAERVVCIEPNEENLAIARRNAQLSGLERKIVFRNQAVAPASGQRLTLFLSQHNHGGHSISREHAAQWGAVRRTTVSTTSLTRLRLRPTSCRTW